METVQSIKIQEIEKAATHQKFKQGSFWEKAEFNRFGIVVVLILFHSCLGSFAVMAAHQMDGLMAAICLSAVVLPNMAANAMCLAVQPMKVVVGFSILSVMSSIIVLLLGLL